MATNWEFNRDESAWFLMIGKWTKPEVGGWGFEVRSWRLEVRSSKLEVLLGIRFFLPLIFGFIFEIHLALHTHSMLQLSCTSYLGL
ncbi:MAG TPA: hypothetical protein DCP28_01465 [Cytophagales bacterium]|nr:hypothetical protein [Cytophagales bacterium]